MKYFYKAVSVSSPLKYLFTQNPTKGTIKGVFGKTVIFDIATLLITVTDTGQRNLPFGILCDFSNTNLKNILSTGDNVVISNGSMIVENRSFEISIEGANFWTPEFQMPISKENFVSINNNLKFINQQIISKNILDGAIPLFNYLPDIAGNYQTDLTMYPILVQKMYRPVSLLFKAFSSFEEDLIIAECKQLIGLGSGLTPSGDDVLTGLFGTLIITLGLPYRDRVMELLNKILPQINGLTNDISLNYYESLSKGYFPERFSTLISEIIFCKEPQHLQPALEKMFAWGKTSGYEIILGMNLGFLLSIQNLNNPFVPISK